MPQRLTVEEHYTIDEVAALLRVDYSTVWRWIKKERIKPVRKVGPGTLRIPASSLNAFLEERTV